MLCCISDVIRLMIGDSVDDRWFGFVFRRDSVDDRDGDLDRYRRDVGDTVPAELSRVGRHCRPHLLHHPQGNPLSNEGNPLNSWWTQPLLYAGAFMVHLHLWLVKRLRLRWFGWLPLFYWRTSGGRGGGQELIQKCVYILDRRESQLST